jgi:hypothetical protein
MRKYIEMEVTVFVVVYITDGISQSTCICNDSYYSSWNFKNAVMMM